MARANEDVLLEGDYVNPSIHAGQLMLLCLHVPLRLHLSVSGGLWSCSRTACAHPAEFRIGNCLVNCLIEAR